MENYQEFNVSRLKEELKSLGLPTAGSKSELVLRLVAANPRGKSVAESAAASRNLVRDEEPDVEAAGSSDLCFTEEFPGAPIDREMAILRRENELMKKELELQRRETEILRQTQNATFRREEVPQDTKKMNIMAVADLLSHFDGDGNEYERWEKQVTLLRRTYNLTEAESRILIGSRLRGKALNWFHSKPEFIELPLCEFFRELRSMFDHRPNKIARRRQFEQRIWKRGETFSEYFYDKVILGNRVPIEEDEIMEHIIEGISDPMLRNQACIQQFEDKVSLLAAFEKVRLYPAMKIVEDQGKPQIMERKAWKKREDVVQGAACQGEVMRRCRNCGAKGHLFAECPAKDRGRKCFECREFGHISTNCPHKKPVVPVTKDSCGVSQSFGGKFYKDTKINGHLVKALIDTGSDVSLMRASKYVEIGVPQLIGKELTFRGVGSGEHKTFGEFTATLMTDGSEYNIKINVIPDNLTPHDLIIGTDFLNNVETLIREGQISIRKPNPRSNLNEHEILNIDCIHDSNSVDLSCIENKEYRSVVETLIQSYQPLKTRSVNIKMNIVLKDDEPVYQRARRLSPSERETVNKQIDEWMSDGIVQPSLSDYASPIVLVDKKDGSKRLCVDYRLLNAKTVKDRYPLPLIEDQLDLLQGAKIFSTLDLKNGFFHVSVDPNSRRYTAFIVPDGQYEFLKVPFGLCNSPAIFQRFINAVFKDLIVKRIVLTYMDDLIVPSCDYASALENLKTVLETASQYGLIINWKKCSFLQTCVEFLGHVIENGCVRPSVKKTAAVINFPRPKTVKQLQSFLGLAGYFRKFIYNYSIIARPLSDLLKKENEFKFGEKELCAFEQLKTVLSNKPVLRLYRANAETELHTDASSVGYGAILLQRDMEDGTLHPIYYMSGKTNDAEAKYPSYELEALAIVKAVKRFRVYLLGIPFVIITDCKAFALTLKKKDLCVRVARWALLLEEFEYTIKHRSGKSMLHVDALSRQPLPSCLVIDQEEEGLIARLKKAQRQDEAMTKMFAACEKGQVEGYVVKNGLLFKEVDDEARLVVPSCMQSQIIRRSHQKGHFAAGKTLQLLKREYWFPNMLSKVEKIVQNCIDCILVEKKQGKQEGLLHAIDKGDVPLQTYHVDHLGPVPSTRKNYKYVFVVIDAFSKFVWLYPTRSTDSAEVLNRLKKQAAIFGNPRRIISDRGTAFTSSAFEEYCKYENIQHVKIVTGVPRGNGQVERVNRTLIPLLAKLSGEMTNGWYKHLDTAQKYLNSTPHRSTGIAPFNLLIGTNMRIQEDPLIREMLNEEQVSIFQEERDEIRAKAKGEIAKIQEQNRKQYNRKRKKARQYKEGDLVAIQRTQFRPGTKFAAKYLGPYEVTAMLRNDRYMVSRIGEHEGPAQTSTSADHMKPWTTDQDDEDDTDDQENNT